MVDMKVMIMTYDYVDNDDDVEDDDDDMNCKEEMRVRK